MKENNWRGMADREERGLMGNSFSQWPLWGWTRLAVAFRYQKAHQAPARPLPARNNLDVGSCSFFLVVNLWVCLLIIIIIKRSILYSELAWNSFIRVLSYLMLSASSGEAKLSQTTLYTHNAHIPMKVNIS